MPRKRPPPGEYAVGYGRPPEATRFKPGQSGNPRGRPKGARSTKAILDEELFRLVAVPERGRQRRVPVLQALVRATAAKAAKGEVRALLALATLMQRTGLHERDEHDASAAAQQPLTPAEEALLREALADLRAERGELQVEPGQDLEDPSEGAEDASEGTPEDEAGGAP